eukprot:311197_1
MVEAMDIIIVCGIVAIVLLFVTCIITVKMVNIRKANSPNKKDKQKMSNQAAYSNIKDDDEYSSSYTHDDEYSSSYTHDDSSSVLSFESFPGQKNPTKERKSV